MPCTDVPLQPYVDDQGLAFPIESNVAFARRRSRISMEPTLRLPSNPQLRRQILNVLRHDIPLLIGGKIAFLMRPILIRPGKERGL